MTRVCVFSFWYLDLGYLFHLEDKLDLSADHFFHLQFRAAGLSDPEKSVQQVAQSENWIYKWIHTVHNTFGFLIQTIQVQHVRCTLRFSSSAPYGRPFPFYVWE